VKRSLHKRSLIKLSMFTHVHCWSRSHRDVTKLVGAREKKQVWRPHFQTLDLLEAYFRTRFTYRLYRLKPRASRSKGVSQKLWYA